MSNLTIIRGPAGSGKTTRLRKFVNQQRGRIVLELSGSITEQALRREVIRIRPDVVFLDDADAGQVAIFQEVAPDFPRVEFAVATAS